VMLLRACGLLAWHPAPLSLSDDTRGCVLRAWHGGRGWVVVCRGGTGRTVSRASFHLARGPL
jgi:GH24 family phage-related lysozyme (muramidase)